MKVRFEEKGNLVEEVVFPHAELPLGEEVLIQRIRYRVGRVDMAAEGGELKVVVEVTRAATAAA